MRRAPLLLSTTIAASLVCATLELPATAHAASPAAYWFAAAPEEGGADDALAEAQDLYQQGEIKFQTADYEEALALWKKAYAMLPDGEENRAIRHALVYNIAEAHSRAYEVSRNPTHLRKAKILLENYRVEHLQLYGDDPDAVKERTEVDDRIAELDKKLADSAAANEVAAPLEEGDATNSGTTPQPQPQPQPQPKPLTPSQQWEADIKNDPTYGPMWVKGGKQVVGGAVLTGIGGTFVLIGAGAIWSGANIRASSLPGDLFDGTGSFIVGGVFAALGLGMLIPGAILIASGSSKRKQVKRDRPRPTATVVPSFGPKGASFGVALRF